jgi:hypothetical protein
VKSSQGETNFLDSEIVSIGVSEDFTALAYLNAEVEDDLKFLLPIVGDEVVCYAGERETLRSATKGKQTL